MRIVPGSAFCVLNRILGVFYVGEFRRFGLEALGIVFFSALGVVSGAGRKGVGCCYCWMYFSYIRKCIVRVDLLFGSIGLYLPAWIRFDSILFF